MRVSPAKYLRASKVAPISRIIAEAIGFNESTAKELLRLGAAYYQPGNVIESGVEGSRNDTLHLRRIIGDFIASEGDAIRFYPNPRAFGALLSPSFSWNDTIITETDDYLVINKPAGVPCHASADNFVDNVLWSLQTKRYTDRFPPTLELSPTQLSSVPIYAPKVNLYLPQRLDTDTSGVLLVAKSEDCIAQLGKLLQQRKYRKWYKLLVCYRMSSAHANNLLLHSHSKKLLGLFTEGDVLESYLVKSNTTPKDYVWDASNHSQDSVQDARLRITSIQRPITKSVPQWKEWMQQKMTASQLLAEQNNVHFISALDAWLSTVLVKNNRTGGDDYVVFQEITVELLTGRTHQIRGQMQALQRHANIPDMYQNSDIHLAGDHLYPGITFTSGDKAKTDATWTSPYLALVSQGLEVNISPSNRTQNYAFTNSSCHISTSATKNRGKKGQILKTSLKFELSTCWWSPLYDNYSY